MTNLLLLHESEQPTLLSMYESMLRFGTEYGVNVRKQFASQCTKEDLNWTDVCVCVRGDSPRVYSLLRFAKEIGKKIIYFLDDDLKDIPKGSFRYPRRKKWLIESIRQCSIIWSSNQLIVDEYLEYVNEQRGVVTHTAVSEDEIVTVPADSDRIKIVYAASESHMSNFNKNIAPFLPELFAEYGETIELHLIGIHPKIDLGKHNAQVHFVDGMPLNEYYKFMKTHHYDIGLAPLTATHFTERKYFNKYIEYTKVGICGVYSDVMPFKLAVKNDRNGYLTENEPSAWLKTLRKVLNDKEGRERIAAVAQEHLRTEHNEKNIFSKLAKDIPELAGYKARTDVAKWPLYVKVYKVRQFVFKVCELMYLTMFSLSHFGIRVTIEKIKRKMV